MRNLRSILLIVLMVVLSGACQRRPFAENRSKVSLNLSINTHIINHVQEELPENMRVDLYDPETAQLIYTDYVGPYGGYINPAPGVYDMIIYSLGTESTLVHNEYDYNEIEAYTNEVSAFIKSQLEQFLTKRTKAARERAAKKYAMMMQQKQQNEGLDADVETKDPIPYIEEPVVNEPDHIFIGWYHNLEVPVTYEGEGVKEIFVEVDAHTIVETWEVEVRMVDGARWISSVVSLMSGQKGSVHMGPNVHSEKVVSVLFDMALEDREDGGKCIKGKLNTFGIHPDNVAGAYLDLNVKDTGGEDHVFHYDVTEQFIDNEDRYILIEETLKIEEPKVEGGGFQPIVNPWDEVHTDIIL